MMSFSWTLLWLWPFQNKSINLWYLYISCSVWQVSLNRELQVSVCGMKWCHLQVGCPCCWSMLARWLQELQQLKDSFRKAGPVMWHSAMSGGRVFRKLGLWLVKRPSDRFKSPTEAACSQSAINTAGSSAGILDGALLKNMFVYT